MSTVTERTDSNIKLKEPLPGGSQIQMNIHTNTLRSNKFGLATFQWLRDISFNNISAKLFVQLEAKYAQINYSCSVHQRAQAVQMFKSTERAVSILGQNPDTVLKIIVINLNEYLQVLCALRAFLTRYRQPDHMIETPLHSIFCHLFEFQSDFLNLRISEGKRGAAIHDLYFFPS